MACKADVSLIISSVFNDFGKDFACVDATGENPQSGMIVHVEEVSCPFHIDGKLMIRAKMRLSPAWTRPDTVWKMETL